MPTPFGTLYSSNITPDPQTGIGTWTADQFYAMMHSGRFPDGGLFYPAMPFASYTKVTRADSDAIFAYLRSVAAGASAQPSARSAFPFQQPLADPRLAHAVLHGGRIQARPDQVGGMESRRLSGRGPRPLRDVPHRLSTRSAAVRNSQAFEGGLIPMQNWYAPSLTSNKEAGLGDWSIEEISDLLRTGIVQRGAVYGPMAEVVYNSLQYLTDDDIRAMAVYLKSLAEGTLAGTTLRRRCRSRKQPAAAASARRSTTEQCAICHGATGLGKPPHYPPLAGNPVDPDGIGGESDPHGAEWRLPARAPPAIRGPTACRLSRSGCPTTRSPPSSLISAPPGAITAIRSRRAQANELRSAPLD